MSYIRKKVVYELVDQGHVISVHQNKKYALEAHRQRLESIFGHWVLDAVGRRSCAHGLSPNQKLIIMELVHEHAAILASAMILTPDDDEEY